MWTWSKLSAAKWEDAWAERVYGNPNAVISRFKGGKTIRVTVYCESEPDARTLLDYFGGSIKEVKGQDWITTQSQQKTPPLKIRDALLISTATSPTELDALRELHPKRQLINIPAEMAFGTGDHATTSTCLRLICDFAKARRRNKSLWTMCDVGCGTALLAFAAVKLGGARATAFDFDPIAVEVARSNQARNGIDAEQLHIFTGDVFQWNSTKPHPDEPTAPVGPYDLVVANLFSTILQRAFPTLIRAIKPTGTLIVSGILASQWEETRLAAELAGLHFDQVIKKGKWVTARAAKTF